MCVCSDVHSIWCNVEAWKTGQQNHNCNLYNTFEIYNIFQMKYFYIKKKFIAKVYYFVHDKFLYILLFQVFNNILKL